MIDVLRRGQPPNGQFTINRQSPQARGLVSWVPFGAANGARFVRDVVNGNQFTFSGTPTPAFNNAAGIGLDFVAGSTEYIYTPASNVTRLTTADPLTISVWVVPRSVTTQQTIFRSYNAAAAASLYLQIWNDGRILWGVENGYQFSLAAEPLAIGILSHIVVSFPGGLDVRAGTVIYLNNKDVTDTTGSSSSTTTYDVEGQWRFGRNLNSSSRYLTGELYDFRLYCGNMSAATVSALYNPSTRWDLYQPIAPPRYWLLPQAVAGGAAGDALTADDLTTGTPTLDSATLTQTHALTADDITAGTPTLDTATLGQTHALTADDIATGTPLLDSATLTQAHVFTADDVSPGTPLLDSPVFTQAHNFIGDDIATGNPTLTQAVLAAEAVDPLSANDLITGAPLLDSATIGQVHVFTADDLTTGTPTLDSPTLTQLHVFTADDLTAGTPTLDSATFAISVVVVGTFGTVTSPAQSGGVTSPAASGAVQTPAAAGTVISK